jgi:8-oxo-dGTP diphosphatase
MLVPALPHDLEQTTMSQTSPATCDPQSVSPGDEVIPYERPSVAVDIVLLAWRDDELSVLLIRRRHGPYEGYWALPGGFVGIDESLEEAAARELAEETGIQKVSLNQVHTYGKPKRDPRMRVISVAYWGMLAGESGDQARGGDDAAEASWWPVADLPPLAFDHDTIIADALARSGGSG